MKPYVWSLMQFAVRGLACLTVGEAGSLVRTAQTRLAITVEIGTPRDLLSLLGARIRLPLYLEVAEADRIRMLQSPTGAPRDKNEMVWFYERLLPYAVLWGVEREWLAVMQPYLTEPLAWWAPGDFSADISAIALAVSIDEDRSVAEAIDSFRGGARGQRCRKDDRSRTERITYFRFTAGPPRA